MPSRTATIDRRSRRSRENPVSAKHRRSHSLQTDHDELARSLDTISTHEVDRKLSNPETASDRVQDQIECHARNLCRHLGLPESPGMPPPELSGSYPLFLVEVSPASSKRGAKCKLPGCSDRIIPSSYRLALTPSMRSSAWEGKTNSGRSKPVNPVISAGL